MALEKFRAELFAIFLHLSSFLPVLPTRQLPLTQPISGIFLKFLKFQSSFSHIVPQLVRNRAVSLYGDNSIVAF